MGIKRLANKAGYAAWWDLANYLIIARGFLRRPRGVRYPDLDFEPIANCMKRSPNVYDQLVTGSAANNQTGRQDKEEGVVPVVEDDTRKLFNTVKTNSVLLD